MIPQAPWAQVAVRAQTAMRLAPKAPVVPPPAPLHRCRAPRPRVRASVSATAAPHHPAAAARDPALGRRRWALRGGPLPLKMRLQLCAEILGSQVHRGMLALMPRFRRTRAELEAQIRGARRRHDVPATVVLAHTR